MEQWYRGGHQRVLLQQLDDSAVSAALAAVHPAQLHPVPKVSVWVSAALFVHFFYYHVGIECKIHKIPLKGFAPLVFDIYKD